MRFFYVIEVDSQYLLFGNTSDLSYELGRLSVEFQNGFQEVAIFKSDFNFDEMSDFIRDNLKSSNILTTYESGNYIYEQVIPRCYINNLDQLVTHCLSRIGNSIKVSIGNPMNYRAQFSGNYDDYLQWCTANGYLPIINNQRMFVKFMKSKSMDL